MHVSQFSVAPAGQDVIGHFEQLLFAHVSPAAHPPHSRVCPQPSLSDPQNPLQVSGTQQSTTVTSVWRSQTPDALQARMPRTEPTAAPEVVAPTADCAPTE